MLPFSRIACNVQKKQAENTVATDNMELHAGGDSTLCDVEFRAFLKDSLRYIKPPSLGGFVLLKRDDRIIQNIRTKFKECVIGKTLHEIVDLFGDSGTINGEIRYSCVNEESELFTSKLMILIFEYDEQLIIKEVFYRPRGIGIEGDGEPSILDEEKKRKEEKEKRRLNK